MFVTYEGGQHFKKNADVYCSDPKIHADYSLYLSELAGHFDLFMHYTHNGTWGKSNAWGAKNRVGQPMAEAHKYRALYEYAVQSGQYDPKTGKVRRLAGQSAKAKAGR